MSEKLWVSDINKRFGGFRQYFVIFAESAAPIEATIISFPAANVWAGLRPPCVPRYGTNTPNSQYGSVKDSWYKKLVCRDAKFRVSTLSVFVSEFL
ncbi:hypothetical protein [Fischerella sp. PCC 9605]|uniref:hypothetical protein n=1 Tax=Fischerella sp. PCC 9605 TaxID=1173024 RepID=UPI00047A9F17|nr:hypothetical protein [Fischerella sp. PCC 9605]